MAKLSILMPSRLARAGDGTLFLERAIHSIRAQTGHAMAVEILIGIDAGAVPPTGVAQRLGVRFLEGGKSQAEALNAAAAVMTGDHIAILEDDDQWNAGFLYCAFHMLKTDFDFVSSTQLEVTSDGKIIRVTEFPTPSGWVMHRATWDKVGLFNPEYRFHLDNEWLGRLGLTDARRVHLCEATTPMDYNTLPKSRPFLGELLRNGKPKVELARHDSPWPMVVRLCHPGSGMAQVGSNDEARARSHVEMDQLKERFGHFPW